MSKRLSVAISRNELARVFLGRPRQRKSTIWHLISKRGRKLELKRPHSWRFTRKGPSIPAPADICVPDTRLGCPGLRCGERLNRKALRARLQQLGRGYAALATVNHAAHKTGIQPATLGDKTFYVSHLGGLHSRPSPIAAASFLPANLPVRPVRGRSGHRQVIIMGRVTDGPRPCPLVAQSGHARGAQQMSAFGSKADIAISKPNVCF
jgi:hypothetical protein